MKKLLIIILNVFILQCYPQNLIKNPSFEDYYSCPSEISQIDSSKYWTSGLNECSSDYYHTCMLVNNNPGSLEFECLTKHKGRTGFAFAGIILANKFYTQENNQINYREAIQTKLYHQLISNNCYTVEFYFKFYGFWCSPNSSHINFAINSFGAFLSQDSIVYDNLFSETIFTHAPQVKFNEFTISDSINWKKISGSFFANGNEQFITITNFSTNDSTQFEFSPYLNSNSDSLFGNFSYYIIDDVSVYPCDAPVYFADAGKDTCVKHGSSIILGLPNHDEYLYWWINGNTGDTISRQSQIVVSPQVTTTYILVQKDFKFDETRDTVIVEVGNNCYELQIPEIIIPNIITPNGDGYNDKFEIENSKYYNVSVSLYNRWGNLIYESINYKSEWPEKDIADGVYYYTVTYSCTNQEIKTQSGSVSVVR